MGSERCFSFFERFASLKKNSSLCLTLRAHPNAGAFEFSRAPGWTPVRRELLRREEDEEVEETPLTPLPPPRCCCSCPAVVPPPLLLLLLLLLFSAFLEEDEPLPPLSDLWERSRRRRDGEGGGGEETEGRVSFFKERDVGIDERRVGDGVSSSCWPSCFCCCSPAEASADAAVESSAAATSPAARRALDARLRTIAGVSVGAEKGAEGALSFRFERHLFFFRLWTGSVDKASGGGETFSLPLIFTRKPLALFAPSRCSFFFVYIFRKF